MADTKLIINIPKISGEFSFSGLSTSWRVTTMDVNSAMAYALPMIPLADRNSMAIHNTSTIDTLFIGPTNTVTADNEIGVTSGWEIGPGDYHNVDLKKNILTYARAPIGKTIRVKILEAA